MNNSRSVKAFNNITRSLFPGVLFILFILPACKNDPNTIRALTQKGLGQEDKAQDVTIIISEHGKVKVKLFSHTFIRNEVAKPPYTDMKDGVKAEVYNDSGMIENTITARYARYYEQQGNILVRDSVVIINKKGEKLNTEELVWNQSIKKIYTEKFVKITTPKQILYGDGLEANDDFSTYQIKNFKGSIQVGGKDELSQ
jgi:LPS export ABC transporter protein LptC